MTIHPKKAHNDRKLARQAAAGPVTGLTDDERGFLKALVRAALLHKDRSRAELARKFGPAFDSSLEAGQVTFIENVYRRLGGDPAAIPNRPPPEGHGAGYHRPASYLPTTDYSRRRDPNGADTTEASDD